MKNISVSLAIFTIFMVVVKAASSATATPDEFKGAKFQGSGLRELIYSYDNGSGANVAPIVKVDRDRGQYLVAHDGVKEGPRHLAISVNENPSLGVEGGGFLTLDFRRGFSDTRAIRVVNLISDANKWRQTYSDNGTLEFVLGDYSSQSKMLVGGSRDGLVTIAGLSSDLSRIPLANLEDKWVDNGVSVSNQDAPTVPLPLPSAVWLFGSALVVFVVLSTRRQV